MRDDPRGRPRRTSAPWSSPGVINLRRHPGRRARRLLLRARPVQPAGLLDRRQRRGELRRRALPEVRLHHQPRARRSRSSTPDGEVVAARRHGAGRARLRPARRVRRLRGHARHRHQGDRAAGARARGGAARCWPASTAPTQAGAGGRRRSSRAGIVPGGDRDDGRAGDRGGRGGRRTATTPTAPARCWSSSWTARRPRWTHEFAEVERLCRDGRRVRDPDRRRRRRAGADLEGPQVGVRRGRPDQPRLHRPGRRHPAHRAARGAARDRRAVAASPASGSPTSSTPATATCTRWCSSTTPCEGAGRARPRRSSGAILDLCIEHGGSITGEHGVGVGQGEVHAADVHRRRPRHHAAGALRLRPGRPVQPRQGVPDPAAVRRGARAAHRARTRCSEAGLAEVF